VGRLTPNAAAAAPSIGRARAELADETEPGIEVVAVEGRWSTVVVVAVVVDLVAVRG
jgi:hypothetical protein